jgi:general stress protein 26
VYGVLLMPEKEAKPKFVEITLNLKVDVDEEEGSVHSYWKPALDEYFHGKTYINF